MLQDLRLTLHALVKAPLFTLLAAITFAVGIGANTATFSILKSVSLNPLPYRQPEQLVTIAEADEHTTNPNSVSPGTVREWRNRSNSFKSFCLWGDYSIRPITQGHVELVRGLEVNYDFFDVLGAKMLFGRTFTNDDDRPSTSNKLILSYALWKGLYGGNPSVINRSITTVGGDAYTIVGVLPADFHPIHMSNPGEIPQLYAPLGLDTTEALCRSCRGLRVIGRLKPGVTPNRARIELNAVMRRLAREYPADYSQKASVALTPLREQLVGRFDQALSILFGAVALVLLLTCANVANILLARATARKTEMAIRASLGANRWQLMRPPLLESLILAFMGGLFGVSCAYATTRLIAHFGASEIPRVDEISPDGAMLLWGLTVSLISGLIAGLPSALKTVQPHISKRPVPRTLLNSLIAVEIALSFVLVSGVGVLIKSYQHLLGVNLGYDPGNVLTISLLPDSETYDSFEKRLACYGALVTRLRGTPGVEAVGYASTLPLSNQETRPLFIREHPVASAADAPKVDSYRVSPGYFPAMKISLLGGRLIGEQDRRGLSPVALVSQSCARIHFHGEYPIGQHVRLDETWATVIGIVNDVHQYGLDRTPTPAVYFAFVQPKEPQGWARLVVRSSLPPERAESALRDAIKEVAPSLPIFHLQPMNAYVAKSIAQRTFALWLIAIFGLIALLLASVGVYGVVSYTVRMRRRELGIRVALGARPQDIGVMILREVFSTAIIGLAIGLSIAFWCSPLIAKLLFEAKPIDWTMFSAVAALMTFIALTAAFTPARRAALHPAIRTVESQT